MEPIGNPETSVSNHFTPYNNPEDGKIKKTSSQASVQEIRTSRLKLQSRLKIKRL
jgi:hypothetical protein